MTNSYLLPRRGVLLPLCLLSLLSIVGVLGDMPSLDELLIVPNFKLAHPIERFESNSIEWRWQHPYSLSHAQQQQHQQQQQQPTNVNDQDRTLEHRTVEGSLAFQLSTPNGRTKSQLLTFDENAQVGQVRSILGSTLFEDQLTDKVHSTTRTHINCQFVDEQGQVYDDDTIVMGELLTKHILEHGKNSLQLECVELSTPISHRSNPSRRGHIATMAASRAADKTAEAPHVKKTSHIFNFLQFVEKPYTGNEIHARNVLRRSITGELAEYPLESAELIAATWAGVWGWVSNWIKYHWGPIHDYPDYTNSTTQTGRWHLNTGEVLQPDSTFGAESDSRVRIAIAADWAAGTMESDFVQNVMMNGNGSQYNLEWTLHIGDIYYLGASEFVNSNCLGQPPAGVKRGVTWPHGSIGSFAVEGNHEMYSRGGGFFDDFLPTLGVTDPKTGKPQGQQAGYVSMENRYWRVILLDTGYNTYGPLPGLENKNNTQPEVIMDWLVNVVRISDPLDKRGIIFFSHHQVESAFQSEVSQATPNQIADVVPSGRQVLWLYGHEHRLAFYNTTVLPNDVRVLGRCIGNGGFPSTQAPIPARARESGLIAYDDRLYKLQPGIVFDQNLMFNGFVHMDLEGPQATFKYSTLAIDPITNELSPTLQTDLVEEVFQIDNDGNVQLTSLLILNDGMTVISNH